MNIKGRVVVITGSSKGIGKATASLFVKEGAKVVIIGRSQKDIDSAVKELIEVNVLGVKADIRDIKEVKQMVNQVLERFGRIDILINNAGVYHPSDFLTQEENLWNEEVDINIKGVLNCTYTIAPIMTAQNDGVIINISSGAGKRGGAGYAVYSATKFAVLGFTQGFADEAIKHNVRVYAVCPGTTATQMTGFIGMQPSKVAKRILETAKETLGLRPGEATEIYY